MRTPAPRAAVAVMTLCLLGTACAGARGGPPEPTVGVLPPSEADIRFMAGMIPHHAQAVLMAGWAESHGAAPDVQLLCEKIIVSQRDEIRLMRNWLRDHGQAVPDSNATHMTMVMEGGMVHEMLMPGMLTEEQLAELDAARGPEFDRLFLGYMIMHHEGALVMVDELFESYGGAQNEVVFRFASDVYADQMAEIDRMQQMLEGRSPAGNLSVGLAAASALPFASAKEPQR